MHGGVTCACCEEKIRNKKYKFVQVKDLRVLLLLLFFLFNVVSKGWTIDQVMYPMVRLFSYCFSYLIWRKWNAAIVSYRNFRSIDGGGRWMTRGKPMRGKKNDTGWIRIFLGGLYVYVFSVGRVVVCLVCFRGVYVYRRTFGGEINKQWRTTRHMLR